MSAAAATRPLAEGALLDTPEPVASSFWEETAKGAPRVWFITCIAGIVASGVALTGDFANLALESRNLGLGIRLLSIAFFAGGVFLAKRHPVFVQRHYQSLMLLAFPVVAIPVTVNSVLAQDRGALYWFGILQLELAASTFFVISTPAFLTGAWGSTAFYLAVRLGVSHRAFDNADANVLIGLVIFTMLASFTHLVLLRSRQDNHAQRHRLYLQHAQKSQILGRITDAFMALDPSWRVVFMNRAAEEILQGLRPDGALLGHRLWDEFPGLHDSLMFDEFHRAVDTQGPVLYEEYYPLLDRELQVKAFPAPEGLTVYFHDVTDLVRTRQAVEEARATLERRVDERTEDLVRAKARLETTVAEKEVLLREVHHRAKNNMQVLSSLMRLQTANVENDEAKSAFRESEQRIRAMALVHENLYQSQDLARVRLRNYLTQLVNQLVPAYTTKRVQLAIDVADVELSLDVAVPCGLLVNELISNALRHAFANVAVPELQLRVASAERDGQGGFELLIRDNGVGISPGGELPVAASLGLRLVKALAQGQLRGTIQTHSDSQGTEVRVWFPGAR